LVFGQNYILKGTFCGLGGIHACLSIFVGGMMFLQFLGMSQQVPSLHCLPGLGLNQGLRHADLLFRR